MQKFFSAVDFKSRRQKLLESIKTKYSNHENSAIVLFASFENGACKFKQESSFYYFTGVNEPAAVLVLEFNGTSTLYIPNYGQVRMHWVAESLDPNNPNLQQLDYNEIKYLGETTKTFELHPFFTYSEYQNLFDKFKDILKKNGSIFTLNPQNQYSYFQQRFTLNRISEYIPEFLKSVVDISDVVAHLRRVKSKREIEALYQAINTTILGHEAVLQVLQPNKYENEIQAGVEYIFTFQNAQLAFPSIVGSGKNSTILHYTANNHKLNEGDLVVVDIGAEIEHYCGDLTRTYPVSKYFSKRQREIYNLVLETQEYIENIARPGLYLSNHQQPDNSLNHLAKEFLKERGYEKYFLHGIGHFLGLDVHDVGNLAEPLQAGDVITIEPGIYISQENIGVRIEDNYWVVEDGLVCLSEQLPKRPEEIENLLNNQELANISTVN